MKKNIGVKRFFLFFLCIFAVLSVVTSMSAYAMAAPVISGSPRVRTIITEPLPGQTMGEWMEENGISQSTAAKKVVEKDYISQFLETIKDKLESPNVSSTVKIYALQVFWVLVFIEIFLATFDFVKSGESTVNGWASLVIRQIIVISFFYWMINNAATFFADILHWFKIGGQSAGSVNIADFTVGKITQRGTQLTSTLMSKAWEINGDFGVAMIACCIPALAILYCFTYMALTYIAVATQAYFAVTLGMFVVGAGGCRLSRDIAVNGIRTVIGMGLKLFTIILLIGMALSFTEEWTIAITQTGAEFDPVIAVALKISAVSLILAGMVKELPSFAGSFISSNAASGGSGSVMASVLMSTYDLAHTVKTVSHASSQGIASTLAGRNFGHPLQGLQNWNYGSGGLIGALHKFSEFGGKGNDNAGNNDMKKE